MDAFLRDLRYACRSLLRQPGFAALAIATMALGIGANAAIFSAVDAVLLRPLDYPHPERIVVVATDWRVTPEFFRVFGIDAAIGRLIESQNATAGAPFAAVISHDFWTTRFGA